MDLSKLRALGAGADTEGGALAARAGAALQETGQGRL